MPGNTESHMTWDAKREKLRAIYECYESEAAEFKKNAICKIGCTYCCTDVGNVDVNTLEGLIILERVQDLSPALRREVKEELAHNRREKKKNSICPCPFLQKDETCLIYDIRPFSCRQLYSLRECRGRGPTVHRQAVALAKEVVREMQQLDDTGYSGHLSFILHLLDKPGFTRFYLSGGFDPGKIMQFGKAHGIVINRFVG